MVGVTDQGELSGDVMQVFMLNAEVNRRKRWLGFLEAPQVEMRGLRQKRTGIAVHVKKSSLEKQFNKGATSASQVGTET